MGIRARPSNQSTGWHIIVVDDDQDLVDTTALMLEQRGLEVTTETDPQAVIDALDDGLSCVVSDYQMPQMDGLELLAAVRAEDPDLPFILFTGRGSEEIASEAIEAGVTDYLQKGGQEQYDRLANCVASAIENYHNKRVARKRRRQFEAIFENAFDGIFILDVADAVIVDANPRACDLLEYSYEELVGTDIAEIHPEDYELYLDIGRTLIDTDSCRRIQSICYTRNGDAIPSDITAAPMEYDDETFLLTIMRPQSPR
ncbi:response regulator [Haloplanus aerogenes]|uniref:PAS domain S-box-containing protein n=1 Tax=Haloplanus aerogenes TaxID=660522 RepID=A0A3M0DRK7_9EURY|nr:response regulator [Haloplanus aerogenes]AZH24178.1 response regulator [Haloplanus aerogenes]RMB24202.1 PAS domain S-box-containing protein [Haloplanus aerogenes]